MRKSVQENCLLFIYSYSDSGYWVLQKPNKLDKYLIFQNWLPLSVYHTYSNEKYLLSLVIISISLRLGTMSAFQ